MKTESVRVKKSILERLRLFCTKRGIKLSWFVSESIEEKLNREK